MKKFILPMMLVLTSSTFATDNVKYDEAVQVETHCSSVTNKLSVSMTVQNETKLSIGRVAENTTKSNVTIKGKIDGTRININKTTEINSDLNVHTANAMAYSVANGENSVSKNSLKELTGLKTIPGMSLKITMSDAYRGATGTAHLVYSNTAGQIQLSVAGQTETVEVSCTQLRDVRDFGEDYFYNFQKI